MFRVTTVVGAGVGITAGGGGCVVGRAVRARVRAARVSPIAWRVLSILASLLAIRSSSSVRRESVVSCIGGNGVSGESIFAGGGEGASGGVKTSSLDEADRERSPKRVIFTVYQEA